MSGKDSNLLWLQALYDHFAVDDWHEDWGCKIDTLDNPGWSFKFNLNDTPLVSAEFEYLKIERTEHDWLHCRIQDKTFEGFCGPRNLDEVLSVFRHWVEGHGVRVSSGGGAIWP